MERRVVRPVEYPLSRPSAGRMLACLVAGTILAGVGVFKGLVTALAAEADASAGSVHVVWPPPHVRLAPAEPADAGRHTSAAVQPVPSAEQTASVSAASAAPLKAQSLAEPPAVPSAAAVQPPVPATPQVQVEVAPVNPLAEQIHAALAVPGLDGLGITRREQEAIQAFYAARQDQPVFVDGKGLNATGRGVEARLAAAGEDGLNPADYARPKLAGDADAAALARAEIRLAASALLYARHAQAGRFDPSRISPQVTPLRTFPDPQSVLADLAGAPDASAVLAAYNPTHAGYLALKAKLATAKAGTVPAPVHVPSGPTLRPGDVDPRVPVLRARLNARGGGDRFYDMALADAVMGFQASAGLEPDGVVGPATLEAMNRVTSPVDQRSDIIANMERWRWLPRDLGRAYVMVNIPEYMVRVVQDGAVIHQTRVVVGKPEARTPLLTHDMEYVVLNPYWNIPPSIARKEMLPQLQRDPYFLARQGMEVVRGGRVVDPGSVNWSRGIGGYSFRQPPGERNALGRIKFMFPNDHSVYLHDTPSKHLFTAEKRAFSHGCIRVQDPLQFGDVIFNLGLPGQDWSAEKIGKMLGGQERYVMLKQRIPVHLVYFTVLVDEAGRLIAREDVYGINGAVKEILHLEGEQKVANQTSPTVR